MSPWPVSAAPLRRLLAQWISPRTSSSWPIWPAPGGLDGAARAQRAADEDRAAAVDVGAGFKPCRAHARAGLQLAAHAQHPGHAHIARNEDAAGKDQRLGLEVLEMQFGICGAELRQQPARIVDAAVAHQIVEQQLVVLSFVLVAYEPAKP